MKKFHWILQISHTHVGRTNLDNSTECKHKHMSDVYMSKSQSFDCLNLIFGNHLNCILYSQDHRTQLWYHLVSIVQLYIAIKT